MKKLLLLLLFPLCLNAQVVTYEYFTVKGNPTFAAPTSNSKSVDFQNKQVWNYNKPSNTWSLVTDTNIVNMYLGGKGQAGPIGPQGSKGDKGDTGDCSNCPIISGSSPFLMPEQFSDGRIIGIGFAHTLSSAGYNLATASVKWPRTATRYSVPISVGTMTLDWIANQELFFAMEDLGASYMTTSGGVTYYLSNGLLLPKTQSGVPSNRRSQSFIFDFHGAQYKNYTGQDFVMMDRYPTDQANAATMLDYQYVFNDVTLIGNSSKTVNSIGIRLGATTHTEFNRLKLNSLGIGLDLQFCLEVQLHNIKILNYGQYGSRIWNGQWTNAAGFNAQSNVVGIYNYRCVISVLGVYTPVAGLYMNGNHTIKGDLFTFEGAPGSQHHIFYESTSGAGVNVFELSNIYIELAGCTRAGIRIRSGKGQYVINIVRSTPSAASMPVLIEVDNDFWPTNELHVFINTMAMARIDSKLRAVGNINYPAKWYVTNVNMNDNDVFNSAANFDLTLPKSYIPKTTDCRFVKPL